MITTLHVMTGVALYAAVQHFVLAALPAVRQVRLHIVFAALSLSVAGFVLASAQPPTPQSMAGMGRLIVTTGLAFWVLLLWFCALYLAVRPLWAPIALSVALGALFMINLAAPASLVYLDFFQRQPAAGGVYGPLLSQAWLLTHGVLALVWGYAIWVAWRLHKEDNRLTAATLATALILVLAATVWDLFAVSGQLAAGTVSPLAYTALVVICSLMLAIGSLRAVRGTDKPEAALVPAPDRPVPAGILHAPLLNRLEAQEAGAGLHLHWHIPTANSEPGPPESAAVEAPAGTDTSAADVQPPPPRDVAKQADTDVRDIIQLTRIARRRLERGKADPWKFNALFRAINEKAADAHTLLSGEVMAHKERVQDIATLRLNGLIRRAIIGMAAAFRDSGVRVRVKFEKDLPPVLAGTHSVEAILTDLIAHALGVTVGEAEDARPALRVASDLRGDGDVEVTVSGGGQEISLTQVQNAFELLLSSDTAAAATDPDARLIAIAERVEALGGQFWCEPRSAGGLSYHLILPAAR